MSLMLRHRCHWNCSFSLKFLQWRFFSEELLDERSINWLLSSQKGRYQRGDLREVLWKLFYYLQSRVDIAKVKVDSLFERPFRLKYTFFRWKYFRCFKTDLCKSRSSNWTLVFTLWQVLGKGDHPSIFLRNLLRPFSKTRKLARRRFLISEL